MRQISSSSSNNSLSFLLHVLNYYPNNVNSSQDSTSSRLTSLELFKSDQMEIKNICLKGLGKET